jgi:hypothetical protein
MPGGRGKVEPWKVIALEKQVSIGPMSCMEMSVSRKTALFHHPVTLTGSDTPMDALEERINYDSRGNCPSIAWEVKTRPGRPMPS